eukprot:1006490-Prorocentrum_minimum.AAC.2
MVLVLMSVTAAVEATSFGHFGAESFGHFGVAAPPRFCRSPPCATRANRSGKCQSDRRIGDVERFEPIRGVRFLRAPAPANGPDDQKWV